MSRKRKVVADEQDPAKIEFETSEEVDVVPTFDKLRLREDLVRGIYAYGTNYVKVMHMCIMYRRRVNSCICDLINCFSLYCFAGFEKPSAIQQRAIKPIMKGRDVIAQ